VSLRDCFADLLGHGLKVQHISTFESRDGTVSNASESHFSQLIMIMGVNIMDQNPSYAYTLQNGLMVLSPLFRPRQIEVLVG
jgi:hypothetical protein